MSWTKLGNRALKKSITSSCGKESIIIDMRTYKTEYSVNYDKIIHLFCQSVKLFKWHDECTGERLLLQKKKQNSVFPSSH